MEVKQATAPKLYPDIPDDPNVYRYSKILTLEKEVKDEMLKYERLARKYGKGRTVCTGLNYGTSGLAFAAGSVAVGTLASGITILASIPLAAIGGIFTLLSTGCTFISNKLYRKQMKHLSTLEIAKNTLLNLKRMTGKLVTDGKVTQEEFEAVLELERNYYCIKRELREKTDKEKVKKAFEEGQETMRKKLVSVK